MIRRDDFIKAIGQPDKGFEESVQNALAVICARDRAKRDKKRPRYIMILPVAAAAAIFVMFMSAVLGGNMGRRGLPLTTPAPLAQPRIESEDTMQTKGENDAASGETSAKAEKQPSEENVDVANAEVTALFTLQPTPYSNVAEAGATPDPTRIPTEEPWEEATPLPTYDGMESAESGYAVQTAVPTVEPTPYFNMAESDTTPEPTLPPAEGPLEEILPQPTLESEVRVESVNSDAGMATVQDEDEPLTEDIFYYYDMFADGIDALYSADYAYSHSAYETCMTRNGERDCVAIYYGNDADMKRVCWMTVGELMLLADAEENRLYHTLSIDMPENPELVEAVMMERSARLCDMYLAGREYVYEMAGFADGKYDEYRLSGIKFSFDDEGLLQFCEMFFGSSSQYYLLWIYDAKSDTYVLENYACDYDSFKDYFDTGEGNESVSHSEATDIAGKYGLAEETAVVNDVEYSDIDVGISFGNAAAAGDDVLPEEAEGLPDGYSLFTDAFGQHVDALYPGYSFSEIVNEGVRDGQEMWYMENGADSQLVCIINRGSLSGAEEYDGAAEFAAVKAYMPSEPDVIDKFMSATPQWLSGLYYGEAYDARVKAVKSMGFKDIEDCQLYSLTVIFDPDGNVYSCAMQFGAKKTLELSWVVDQKGNLVLSEDN